MKTKKIANHLKLGFLLFGISLLLWSCEKEDFNSDSSEIELVSVKEIKQKFIEQYEPKYFPHLNKAPLWDKLQISTYEGVVYYEVPFFELQNINRKKSSSLSSDKLIAFKNENNENEFNILHFFIPNINKYTLHFFSLENTDNIDGFITFYDLKNNALQTKRFINGKESFKKYIVNDVKNIKDDFNELHPSMPMNGENCETFTENWVTETCLFWLYTDGSVEILFCDYEYYDKEYTSCDGASGTGGTGTTVITIEENFDDFLSQNSWDTSGPYDDWNRLTNCEKDFFKSNPTVVYSAIKNRKAAEAASFNRFDCRNSDGDIVLHNNIGDAYRHAYFAALNTKSMGVL